MLVAAGVYVTSDDELQLLRDYVGGGRPSHRRHPHGLRRRRGAGQGRGRSAAPRRPRRHPVRRVLEPRRRRPGRGRAGAAAARRRRGRASGSTASSPTTPTMLARYEHPRFGAFPAVTSHAVGDGRVTVVGCVPNRALAAGIVALGRGRRARPRARGRRPRCRSPWHPDRCPTVAGPGSSSTGDGSRRPSRSRHPSPTPSPEPSSGRAPMSHCRHGRRGPSSASERQGIV